MALKPLISKYLLVLKCLCLFGFHLVSISISVCLSPFLALPLHLFLPFDSLLYSALRTLFLHFLGAVGFWLHSVASERNSRPAPWGETALSAASVPATLAILLG